MKLEEFRSWMVPWALGLMVLACGYSWWSDGYVLAHLWSWYAVPLGFKAVAWQPLGALCLGVTLPFLRSRPKDKRTFFEQALNWAGLIAAPWVVLLVGWCFKGS